MVHLLVFAIYVAWAVLLFTIAIAFLQAFGKWLLIMIGLIGAAICFGAMPVFMVYTVTNGRWGGTIGWDWPAAKGVLILGILIATTYGLFRGWRNQI